MAILERKPRSIGRLEEENELLKNGEKQKQTKNSLPDLLFSNRLHHVQT